MQSHPGKYSKVSSFDTEETCWVSTLVASLMMRFFKFSSVCLNASAMLLLIGWGTLETALGAGTTRGAAWGTTSALCAGICSAM